MQCPEYVIKNIVRHDDLLTRNFACMVELLSVGDVVGDIESTTVLEQFLKKCFQS